MQPYADGGSRKVFPHLLFMYNRSQSCGFCQSFARGSFGRQHFIELRANVRATTIQRIVRGWLARRRYNKVRRGIIKLQAHVRRRAAKKELKRLKV